ncbi:MAG: hypothetical protein JNK15_05185 [Planctomycetes bacterium]|nr:hypothetical protein [Planctomycetota bacterium]
MVLVAFALFGMLAMGVFAAGGEVPDFAAPVAIVGAMVLQRWRRPLGVASPQFASDRWWLLGGVVVVSAATAIVAWGALATPSRTWDGAAMWDGKAALLAERLTLAQPAFRDPGILLHSRDYPLLQPVLMAALERWLGVGRALFPLVYLTHCALLFVLLRRAGAAIRWAVLASVAFGVTPMVLSPSGGGADSGYAEPLLALAVTATVGGLVGKDRWLAAVGIALLAWAKPEGGLYGAVAVALAWLRADRGVVVATAVGWTSAMALWLVVQRDLQSCGRAATPWSIPLALAGLGAAVVLSHRLVPNVRSRVVLAAAVVVVGALAAPALARLFELGGGVFSSYLAGSGRLGERLGEAPTIVVGIANWAWLRGRFGLAFVVVLLVAWRCGSDAARDPLRWLAVMLGVVALPFVLAPFADLDAHIRASMPRLLCHHVGVAWLAVGLGLAAAVPPRQTVAA